MTKNYMKDGKWIEKTRAPKVEVCACGDRYIKTRPRQKECLRCSASRLMLVR